MKVDSLHHTTLHSFIAPHLQTESNSTIQIAQAIQHLKTTTIHLFCFVLLKMQAKQSEHSEIAPKTKTDCSRNVNIG